MLKRSLQVRSDMVIIGRITGLENCADCRKEVDYLEGAISDRPHHLGGFFVSLKYEEEPLYKGFFIKMKFTRVKLKRCNGHLIFHELDGQIRNMEVLCDD